MARIDKQKYLDKVKEKYGDKVELLSEFQGKERKITICYHCEKHGGTTKEMVAKNVFNRNFCPCKECSSEKRAESEVIGHRMTKEDLYKRLADYCSSRGGTVVETEWTKAKSMYHFKCDNPEHPIFESTADSLFAGKHWCPWCSGRKGNFVSDMETIVKSKNGKMLGKYVNASTPVRVKCLEHDFEWDISLNNLHKGRWCPICNMGLSEKAVWDWYKERDINIIPQYTFDDLVGDLNNKYRFDFAIMSDDNKLQYLLEIDDETHRGNSKKYAHIRQSDNLKNQYCKDHNINLVRIPISYSKLRVMPEEWYRDFISEKLASI